MKTDFAESFAIAQLNALTEQENLIVEMRYGFMGGEPHTLEEIGQHIGVSRERIRQILVKCYRKIGDKGRKELNNGQINEPCATLLSYINQIVRPYEDIADNVIERLVDFAENELSYLPVKTHVLPLLTYLIIRNQMTAQFYIVQSRRLIKARQEKQDRNTKQQIAVEKFQELFSYVIWPNTIKRLNVSEIALFERQREVLANGEGYAGYFHSDKMNRDVQYESNLEYNFLQRLEQLEQVIFYQEQPLKIFYEVGNQQIPYYPDILFILQDGRGVVVEIKPIFKMALWENLRKWTALKIFCKEKGLGVLITDGRWAIQQIQHHEMNLHFAQDVLLAIQNKTLSWLEYKSIINRHDIHRNDFIALVLKYKLRWQLNPFKLSMAIRI